MNYMCVDMQSAYVHYMYICTCNVYIHVCTITYCLLEQKTFELIHKEFPSADPISLLVITGCDSKDKEEVAREYRSDPYTKDIVSHMRRGILAFGFSDLTMLLKVLRSVFINKMRSHYVR